MRAASRDPFRPLGAAVRIEGAGVEHDGTRPDAGEQAPRPSMTSFTADGDGRDRSTTSQPPARLLASAAASPAERERAGEPLVVPVEKHERPEAVQEPGGQTVSHRAEADEARSTSPGGAVHRSNP